MEKPPTVRLLRGLTNGRVRVVGALLAGALLVSPVGDPATAAKKKSPLRMPNLIPLAPQMFLGPATETDPNYAMGGGTIIEGCTPDEIVRKLARRCLRFETVLANVGRGPFEVAYTVDPPRAIVAAQQRIYRADGTYKKRFATESEFHPTHAHFHIKDIYLAKLWRLNRQREVVGRRPIAMSDKNGFCPADIRPVRSRAGDPQYECYGPDDHARDGAIQIVGLTEGWADIYTAHLPDQYIEISDVKDGTYLFEMEIDPHNFFVESSERDNRVCVLLRLVGTGASPWGKRSCP